MIISKLLDKLGLITFETFVAAREEEITAQTESILSMSIPVTSLWQDMLLLPVVGTVDSSRSQKIMREILLKVEASEARIVILDILGVPVVDTAVAAHLIKITRATRLMGCECILSGISPSIAETLVYLGVEMGDVVTTSTLKKALALAFEETGMEIRKRNNAS